MSQSDPLAAIPLDIHAAVATRAMPLSTFADWLEDQGHPWEELVRLLSNGGMWRELAGMKFDAARIPQIVKTFPFSKIGNFYDPNNYLPGFYERVTANDFRSYLNHALLEREPGRWYYRLNPDGSASVTDMAPVLDLSR